MSGDDLRQKNRKIQRRSRTRSRSISRRKKSPSFKEKRRITSARKLPVPYKRNDSSSFSSPTLSTSILNENEFLQRSPPIKYRFSNNM
ncbi:hypothetical protein QR98_0010640 [Sarcoptes scabiei]|uniref:Serine/arginine repetitive matrix protein C-terminal domain-containing protein n=1 Tax=Sarcoptes scabiei TaxID=52283 RepID=A0A131ZV08_SARSC|nr:hypothetical protein QR98_0010640 [Sarcoptes scabiei]